MRCPFFRGGISYDVQDLYKYIATQIISHPLEIDSIISASIIAIRFVQKSLNSGGGSVIIPDELVNRLTPNALSTLTYLTMRGRTSANGGPNIISMSKEDGTDVDIISPREEAGLLDTLENICCHQHALLNKPVSSIVNMFSKRTNYTATASQLIEDLPDLKNDSLISNAIKNVLLNGHIKTELSFLDPMPIQF